MVYLLPTALENRSQKPLRVVFEFEQEYNHNSHTVMKLRQTQTEGQKKQKVDSDSEGKSCSHGVLLNRFLKPT
jgi:hypothetical protein